jgi:hypothetical protein
MLGVAMLGTREVATSATSTAPTASASSSAEASMRPTASFGPSATPAASTGPAAATIPNRAVAEVTTDDLNLRASASQSADILTIMKRGQRLFIIGAATEDAGLVWYRVATVSQPTECGDTCGLIGFAATPPTADDAWIEKVEVDCPTSPITAEAIGRLQPLEALACFGRAEVAITGTMLFPFEGGMTPYHITPEWLAPGIWPSMIDAWWIEFHAAPESQLSLMDNGDIVRAVGHFEDPAATECRSEVMPEFFGGTVPEEFDPISPARVILDCRARFVWTSYEVIGHEVVAQFDPIPAPGNDWPVGATGLAIGESVSADTLGASAEPEHPCTGNLGAAFPIGKTLWWSFTGTGGEVTVDTSGSTFDTIVGIYRFVEARSVMEPQACVDDVDGSLQARITVPTQTGVIYSIQVGGFDGQSGTVIVELR